MPNKYIISCPRSGLNWVRFCIEYYYGQVTPGRTLLIEHVDGAPVAFERSHDPLGLVKKREAGAWKNIDPNTIDDAKVVLIIRDPLEVFVRSADKSMRAFLFFIGNIRFFSAASKKNRKVFYYNDLVRDPETMAQLFKFLDLEPADGFQTPSVDKLKAEWEEVSEKSRSSYDVKHLSGAQTKTDPLNFQFHQKKLSERQKIRVWRFLKQNLTSAEFELLARFDKGFAERPVDLFMRLQEAFRNPKT